MQIIPLTPLPCVSHFPYAKKDNGETEAHGDERREQLGQCGVLLPIYDWRKSWRGIVVARPWGRVEEMKLGSVEDGHGGIDGSLSRPRVR
jgi:hypothetical protein